MGGTVWGKKCNQGGEIALVWKENWRTSGERCWQRSCQARGKEDDQKGGLWMQLGRGHAGCRCERSQ